MATPIKSAEEFFLKVVKVLVLILMALSVAGIGYFLATAAADYSQTPKPPSPKQSPPEKEISMEDLKTYLIEEERRRNAKESAPKPQPGAILNVSPFAETALALFRCSLKFASDSGRTIEETNEQKLNEQRERVRALIENNARGGALRGDAYVKSAESFACRVMSDPSIIALAKESKVGSVYLPTLHFHLRAWDRIQKEKSDFVAREEARYGAEVAAEALRVATAKASAMTRLTGAGIGFAAFMVLALYLLGAKIETNLRDINETMRNRSGT